MAAIVQNIVRNCPLISRPVINRAILPAMYCRHIYTYVIDNTCADIANHISGILRDLCIDKILSAYDDYVANVVKICQSSRNLIRLINLPYEEALPLYEICVHNYFSLQDFMERYPTEKHLVVYIGRGHNDREEIIKSITFIKSLRPQIIFSDDNAMIIFNVDWSS